MVLTAVEENGAVVLRVSIGPEGEILMDMNGRSDMDITEVVKGVSGRNVVLRVCRCRCERDTIEDAESLGISAKFVTVAFPESDREPVPGAKASDAAKSRDRVWKKRWGRCQYCGEEHEILPIPGFMACETCARIEMGVARNAARRRLDNDSV